MAQLKIDIIVDDNGAASKLNQVEAGVKGVESAAASLGATIPSIQQFGSESLKSSSMVSRFASTVGDFAKTALAFSAAGVLNDIVHGIIDWGRASMESASKIVDLSSKTGLTTATIQRMAFVAEQTGLSLKSFTDAAFQLGIRIAGGKDSVRGALTDLGLSFDALKAMRPDEQFLMVVSALEKMEDPQRRNFDAVQLFGKAAKEVMPAIADGYTRIAAEAKIAGDAQLHALDDAGDAWAAFLKNRQTDFTHNMGLMVMAAQGAEKSGLLKFLLAGAVGGPSIATLEAFANVKKTPQDINLKNPTTPFDAEEGKDALREQERALKERERAAKAWRDVNDEMSGRSDIAKGQEALKHLNDVGSLTLLNTERTKQLHDTLGDALEAYSRLGQEAPKAMVDIWRATMPVIAVTNGLSPEQFAKMGQNMAPVDFQHPLLRDIFTPKVGVQNGISPELFGQIGTQMALPAFQAVNPFRNAFEKLGQDLPDIIFRTIQGGGSVVGAVGAAVGAQFSKGFQGALEAVGGDVSKMSGGNKALGVAGASIGAAFTGFSLGQQLGKGKGAMAGAAAGALAGSVVPGIGTAIGAGVGALAGFFGGRSADKKAAQEMIQQREEWIKSMGGMEKLKQTAADLGVNIDKAFSTKKPEEFRKTVESLNAAMEKQKNLTEGINAIAAGTNARAANVTGQGDLNVVGAGAVASFGLQLGTGTSAVDALNALNPALVAMRDALAGGNFQMSEAGNKLLGLAAIVEAERVPFQNLAADGQILQGMMQGNIRDFDLFRAIATDIGTSLQGMIDRGVPTAQILTLAQPQLQALWEAQQKWHVEVDATTQGLLNQAVQQGTVGENMKSIQQQMLDATLGIRDAMVAIAVAMGALPSAAQNAANGMNAAFGTVQPPGGLTGAPLDTGTSGTTPIDLPSGSSWTDQSGLLYWGPGQGSGLNGTPNFATGGIVRARPGGTLVRVGEAGRDEAITPIGRRGGSGGGVTVVVNVEGSLVHQDDLDVVVAQAWSRAVRSNKSGSYTMAQAALGNA